MAKIPIILEPGRADGKLATSSAIFDENKGIFQSEINDIQDTLNSDNSNKPLSAKQGKILKELLDSKVIEAGSVPIDTEPTEGNITHVVNSDGLAKEFNKCNTTIINTDRIANEAIIPSKLSVDIQNLITNLSKTTTFAGIATPTTNPGTPDGPVFYIATEQGIYSNFGGIELIEGEVAILQWNNGTWTKRTTGLASINAIIQTNRIENGAVTTEKIATSAFDDTLSVSGKIAPADVVGEKLNELSTEVDELGFGTKNVLYKNIVSKEISKNGAKLTISDDKVHGVVTETATKPANLNIYNGDIPSNINKDEKLLAHWSSTDSDVLLQIFFYDSAKQEISHIYVNDDLEFGIPANASSMLVRVKCSVAKEYNANIEFAILDQVTARYVAKNEVNHYNEVKTSIQNLTTSTELSAIKAKNVNKFLQGNNLHLADVNENGLYVIDSTTVIDDAPADLKVTALTVERMWIATKEGFVKQTVESILSPVTSKRYYRISKASGVYSEWIDITNKVENITNEYINEYTNNHYNNSYTIDATPSITTDTNSYLAPSGNQADRSADIQAMLTATGCCKLGVGTYRITHPITLEQGQSLIGSGKGTKLRLRDFTDEFIIKLNGETTLRDFVLQGVESIKPSETIGALSGVLIEGNASSTGDNIPTRIVIDGLYISRLAGSAIKLTNTGQSMACQTFITNTHIWNCDIGLNVAYWSEFNHFTNVYATGCYYGCVNNGGNNTYMNCDFSGNKVGMLMDNQYGQSPNNSHGQAIGCVFNHTDGNKGVGIKLLNQSSGFVFSACQLFYSSIYVKDSVGITFDSLNCGNLNCGVVVDGGGVVMFRGCTWDVQKPSITVTNNSNVHFRDCYVRDTGEVVE